MFNSLVYPSSLDAMELFFPIRQGKKMSMTSDDFYKGSEEGKIGKARCIMREWKQLYNLCRREEREREERGREGGRRRKEGELP